MTAYEALLESLQHRQPQATEVINYLVARGYAREEIQAAMRRALDRGDARLGDRFAFVRAA